MQDISFIYLVPVLALIWVVHSEKYFLTGPYTDGSGKKFKAVEECTTDRAHWRDENIKCQSQAKTSRFHCLEANMKAYRSVKYVEICDEPILINKGHYPIFNGSGIQSKECTAETFQDYDALSNETLFFKCLNDKTRIYSIGQLECGEVASTTEDRMFTCDYRRYYWFIDLDHRKTGNTKCYSGLSVVCTQVPEEQCNRDTQELNPDFKCVWKCKDEETRMDKPPYNCIRHNLSSVAPEETSTSIPERSTTPNHIPERSTTPNPNGEEPEDDHKTITIILSSIFGPIGVIVIIIVYLIVRWKRGENCPFVSPCCSKQKNPKSTLENETELAERERLTEDAEKSAANGTRDEESGRPSSSNAEGGADLEMTTLEDKSKKEHSFVLDYIGRKATTDIITKAVRILGIIDADIKNIQRSYLKDQAECNVQLLFKWYRNVGDTELPFVLLAETLQDSNVGGRYLTEIGFSKKQFTYEMGELENEDLQEIDVTRAASKIRNFSSLVRFWGLEERDLEIIKVNHQNNCEEQANSAIQKCLNKGLITKRKDLCDGLVYIEESTVIEEFKNIWIPTKTSSQTSV